MLNMRRKLHFLVHYLSFFYALTFDIKNPVVMVITWIALADVMRSQLIRVQDH